MDIIKWHEYSQHSGQKHIPQFSKQRRTDWLKITLFFIFCDLHPLDEWKCRNAKNIHCIICITQNLTVVESDDKMTFYENFFSLHLYKLYLNILSFIQ